MGALFFAGGIFFCAFAFTIESAAEQVWPCLVPLMASAGGIAMMSDFWLRYLRAKRLVFYITNRRAIVFDSHAKVVNESFRFEEFPAPAVLNYADGNCDVIFHVEDPPRFDETELEHSAVIVRHGLIAIDEGKGLSEWLPGHIEASTTAGTRSQR